MKQAATGNTPRISDAEWEVMNIIWEKETATANVVISELPSHLEWHPKTVKTLINRLVKKGALTYTKQGREFVYKSTQPKKTCVRSVSDSFLRRVFNGSLQPLLVHFIERQKLSSEEIKELKKILNDK